MSLTYIERLPQYRPQYWAHKERVCRSKNLCLRIILQCVKAVGRDILFKNCFYNLDGLLK